MQFEETGNALAPWAPPFSLINNIEKNGRNLSALPEKTRICAHGKTAERLL